MDKLTDIQLKILAAIVSSGGASEGWCFSHEWILGGGHLDERLPLTYKQLSRELKVLRDNNLVEYHRGLMNDDGEVGGAGNGINYRRYGEITDYLESKSLL